MKLVIPSTLIRRQLIRVSGFLLRASFAFQVALARLSVWVFWLGLQKERAAFQDAVLQMVLNMPASPVAPATLQQPQPPGVQ